MVRTARLVTGLLCLASLPHPIPAADAPAAVVTHRYERSIRGTVDGFPFVLLRGNHSERGEAHGFLAAREVIGTCDRMAGFLAGAKIPREKILATLDQFRFRERFRMELDGILRGVRRALPDSADRVLTSQSREIQIEDLLLVQALDVLVVAGCSQFAAWGGRSEDGNLIVGRNFDYPAVYPRTSVAIIAIDPDEPDLHPTLDPLWFGAIFAGGANVRDDGQYLAVNVGGGGALKDGSIPNPVSAGLLLREIAEAAPFTGTADWMLEAIDGNLVVPMILHVAPSGAGNGVDPVAIEYTPQPSTFGIRLRGPAAGGTNLLMANHFVDEEVDLEFGRSGKMKSEVKACADAGELIGFSEAREILHSANQGGKTYYSIVTWPARRAMRVAVGEPGVSATEARYARVSWDDIFSLP